MKELKIRDFPELTYARAEAINTLCVNLSFSGVDMRRIMITSSHASEGKSSLSMNIMRSLANMGYKVVLVDADMRCSAIESDYRLYTVDSKRKHGLADYLSGRAELDDVLYATNIPNACMVPVGRLLSNPLPLLTSDRLNELMDALAQRSDYVIVDAPPVGTVIDAAQIAKCCDGTLLAVRYNSVRRQELINTKNQLEKTGCPILGAVLTMVKYDSYLTKRYYYNSYYSHYTADSASTAEKEKRAAMRARRRQNAK